jgi:hypothetical protein
VATLKLHLHSIADSDLGYYSTSSWTEARAELRNSCGKKKIK